MKPWEHRHGGQGDQAFAGFGLEPRPYLDFSVNLNPLGPPPALAQAWPELLRAATRYPSPQGHKLTQYAQQTWGVAPTRLLPLNGSIEGIYLLPALLNWKRVLIFEPSFFDYRAACEAAGVEVLTWPNWPEPRLEGLAEQYQQVDGVFIGSPNNPTGQVTAKEQVLAWAREFPQVDFVVDHAFLPFLSHTEPWDLSLEVERHTNLWVLHSLTKIFALPGLRLGALLGPEGKIESFKARLPPWRVNGLAEEAAGLLLSQGEYLKRTQGIIAQEQNRFRAELAPLKGLKLASGQVNFLFAQWSDATPLEVLLKQALAAGFLLRDCRNFQGLSQNGFRFAVRMPAENQALIQFFKKREGKK